MDSTIQPTPREVNRFIANIRNRETYDQETGIRKVIIQPFHKSEGSGEQYRRSTRPAALQWLEKNWGSQWRQKYQRNYAVTAAALREAFPGQTGEGQKGFAPPF